MRLAVAVLLAAALAACGPDSVIRPGGQYSGVPDTLMGDTRGNLSSGSISTDGVIRTRRDGYLISPR